MIYPKFLNNNSIIGICAPSSGVGDKIPDYEKSIDVLKNKGYKIEETASVRNDNIVSNTSDIRAEEFNSLINRDDLDMILIARGGEYLCECLPQLNIDEITKHPKWVMGYSDPTSILFSITTKYDISTIYGYNSTSFDVSHECVTNNLNILKGDLVKQHDYKKRFNYDDIYYDYEYKTNNKEFEVTGRIIGGCVEILDEIAGTEFESVKSFNDKYNSDGIIWYFDNYNLNANDFYRVLLKFKYMDWFKNVKCVILGAINNRVEDYITYEEALEKVFPNIPYISDTCVGHTFPKFTIINGSICSLKNSNNSITMEFNLK